MAVDIAQGYGGELRTAAFAHFRNHARGEKRMTAQIKEEIIPGRYSGCAKQVAPDLK
jgi:hypothetical protein